MTVMVFEESMLCSTNDVKNVMYFEVKLITQIFIVVFQEEKVKGC